MKHNDNDDGNIKYNAKNSSNISIKPKITCQKKKKKKKKIILA